MVDIKCDTIDRWEWSFETKPEVSPSAGQTLNMCLLNADLS
jgi:hypothetical protein